ncbi:methyltransferase domain-containing protein [Anaeromyxobacter paludicola]|uniref:Malonyl-[acyl-carrier protein] O-methyltransferase n=1 Tax=Anaeromyxobacter paludicola TaxID=2918171 RepID=A0ABN6NAQ2_9BACT|nr:methyltransferase domain-containing protein [Anaeromyxobacter paludicola]BDG10332.1 malonyl-[acyl-carrier protein] O-methyltransferase [Anaeromyxobacter paludicola]
MNQVDKARVRAAFDRGAAAYDEAARVQEAARDELLALAAPHLPARPRLLDVGAGTGALLARLAGESALAAGVDLAPGMAAAARARCPRARLAVADAERLPFRSGAFDVYLSSSALQWLTRLDLAFAEARRVLAPGGLLAVALFCGETLHELRGSYRAAAAARGAPDPTHRFFSRAEVAAALRDAGLAVLEERGAVHVEWHPDVADLLRALRRIGAGNAAPLAPSPALPRCAGEGEGLPISVPRASGLAGRRLMLDMMDRYRAGFSRDGAIPASYEVGYVVARAP